MLSMQHANGSQQDGDAQMRVLTRRQDNGDIKSHVQCDKCKEVAEILIVAAFVKLDVYGRMSLGEYQRLHEHSKACFEETHQCSAA